MASKNNVLILSGMSALIGLLTLVASAIYLEAIQPAVKQCDVNENTSTVEFCDTVKAAIGSSSLGIIAGSVQIIFCIIAIVKPDTRIVKKGWGFFHIGILILTIIAFSVIIYYIGTSPYWKDMLVKSMWGIDWVFCFFAALFYFFGNKMAIN